MSSELISMEQQRQSLQEDILARLAAGRDEVNSQIEDSLAERLSWRYPYEQAARLPSKLTVTQLTKAAKPGEEEFHSVVPALNKRPLFMSRPEQARPLALTASQRGSIMHYVLQQLDFKHVSQVGLQAQLDTMVKKDMLTAVEAASIDSRKIMEFFASALGQRILQARRVFRESVSTSWWKPDRSWRTPRPRGELLLQGVIDLYFEEEGGLVVVDYKTDRITPQNRLV